MPTLRQKKALDKITENHGNIYRGMIDAGYTEHTASKPSNLTNSKGWKELMKEHLPDNLLLEVHKEGLKANKVISADFEVPDHPTRHKFLDLAYKIGGKVTETPQERPVINILLFNGNNDSVPIRSESETLSTQDSSEPVSVQVYSSSSEGREDGARA